MSRTAWFVLSFLVFPLAAASASSSLAANGVAEADAFELRPGVLVALERPAVYLMNPDQGIDAVDAQSGSLLWTSAAAAKPLLVTGDLLIAQAESARPGVLGIVVLDRGDGTRRLAIDVALPEGVKASVADRLGSTFRAWASVENGQILLGWESVQRRVSPIPPKRGEKLRSRLTGGARLDLTAKTATALAAAPPRPTSPIARLASDNGPAAERLQAGSVLAATSMVGDAGQGRLVLKRWEAQTGAPLADITLTDAAYHLRLPSTDGRHLLVSRKSDANAAAGYTFQLYSLETGKLLGSLEERRSHAFGFVLGNSFVYESLPSASRQGDAWVSTPRQLRAVDLTSGAALWQRPVRDLSYRGPYRP